MRVRGVATVGGLLASCLIASAALPIVPASASLPAGRAPEPRLLFTVLDPRITEASGMVASRLHHGTVWLLNDGGHAPRLFAVARSGRTRAVVTVEGARNVDWEALASSRAPGGQSLLWVGDIGDNNGVRSTISVYRLAEPTTLRDQVVAARRFDFAYPDGPHNAEALVVDPSGRVVVVTKEARGAVWASAHRPRPGVTNRLVRVGSAPRMVTDATLSPDARTLVMRGYVWGWAHGWPGLRSRGRVDLPLQPQGETVAFTADGAAILVGSEGVASQVWRVPLPATVLSSQPSTGSPETPSAAEAAAGPGPVRVTAAEPPVPGGVSPLPWLVMAGSALAAVAAFLLVASRSATAGGAAVVRRLTGRHRRQ